tara:strand:- start:135 stop:311 length:177 start_codon:yes stop_codon:yes gene_type:complete
MFERFIQAGTDPKYLSGKNKKVNKKEKKEERVLPRAGSYTTADIENTKKIYSNTGGKI